MRPNENLHGSRYSLPFVTGEEQPNNLSGHPKDKKLGAHKRQQTEGTKHQISYIPCFAPTLSQFF